MWNNLKQNFDIETRTKYFVHVLFGLFIISILIFSLLIIGAKSLEKKEKVAIANSPNAFDEIRLEAKSAVVWDVINGQELFSKNPDEPLPLASLTKVMTAVTLNGKIKGNQKIEITNEDLTPDGDSKLVVGDIWQADDLRDFTLITSSNDGAFALAAISEDAVRKQAGDPQAEFIKSMNELAINIGLSNSKFFNEHGLDRPARLESVSGGELDKGGPARNALASEAGGAYGSARDMAMLFEYTLKNYPEILEATRYKELTFKSDEKTYLAENTNTIIDQIPNVIASKTGYTDLAGGNLVIAFDMGLNRPIIISVLGSTEEGRFSDVLELVKASVKYIDKPK